MLHLRNTCAVYAKYVAYATYWCCSLTQERERERERERETERDRERQRETERQTDRQREM